MQLDMARQVAQALYLTVDHLQGTAAMERLTVAYGPRGLDRVTVPSKRGSRVAAAVGVARLDCIVWPIVWVRAVCAATVHDS